MTDNNKKCLSFDPGIEIQSTENQEVLNHALLKAFIKNELYNDICNIFKVNEFRPCLNFVWESRRKRNVLQNTYL